MATRASPPSGGSKLLRARTGRLSARDGRRSAVSRVLVQGAAPSVYLAVRSPGRKVASHRWLARLGVCGRQRGVYRRPNLKGNGRPGALVRTMVVLPGALSSQELRPLRTWRLLARATPFHRSAHGTHRQLHSACAAVRVPADSSASGRRGNVCCDTHPARLETRTKEPC